MRARILALLASLVAGSASAALLRERCAWTASAAHPTFTDVFASPLVIDLDGDGISEVVFLAENPLHGNALLEIVSGRDCSTIREIGSPGCVPCVGDTTCRDLDVWGDGAVLRPFGLAAGDLDGDGSPEIVGVVDGDLDGDRRLMAFTSDGDFQWCSEAVPGHGSLGPTSWQVPNIADLDGDGRPEIVVGTASFSSDGHYLAASVDDTLWYHQTVPADLDGDGRKELVDRATALRPDAAILWDARVPGEVHLGGVPADLDRDGRPEVIVARLDPPTIDVLDGVDGTVRASIGLPDDEPGCPGGPGLPAVGDVDGDGDVEIVTARSRLACLLDVDAGPPLSLSVRWCVPMQDCTGGYVNPVLADVDGRPGAEILFRDEVSFRVLDASGVDLFRVDSSSGTLDESVVAADADGDCAGEILVPEDSSPVHHGMRIFEGCDAPLPPYRAIWNQTAYHVTNVNDDGTIPRSEATTTSFRAQVNAKPRPVSLVASTTTLWPPSHRMIRVDLHDENGAPVHVRGVFQDEPLDDRGDGRFEPDAVLGADFVLLRAERDGRADGRVYHVEAGVGDGACETVTTVTVCVPHDRRPSRRGADGCGDGGALYDSTGR